MNIKYNRDNFDVDKFLSDYEKLLKKYLNRFTIYEAINEEFLEFNEELKVNNIIGKNIYLPISSIVYDDMTIINGDEVDLNEGIEAEYVEGFAYMPTSGRLIDIGDFNVSIYSIGMLLLNYDGNEVVFSLVEGKIDKNYKLKHKKNVKNGGILSIEIKKLLKKLEK